MTAALGRPFPDDEREDAAGYGTKKLELARRTALRMQMNLTWGLAGVYPRRDEL